MIKDMAIALLTNHYYVIDLNLNLPMVKGFPSCVKKYGLQNVVVKFVNAYNDYNKLSYVFEHHVPRAHYMFYGAWTMIASNQADREDFNLWTTHIYRDRFVIKKDLSEKIRHCADVFKAKLTKKKVKVICSLQKVGLNKDVIQVILNNLYGKCMS